MVRRGEQCVGGLAVSDARLARHLAGCALRAMADDAYGALLALLVLGYGISVQQLLALRWGDVDLSAQTLTVSGFPVPLTVRFRLLMRQYQGCQMPPASALIFPGVTPRQARRRIGDVMGEVNEETLMFMAWVGAAECAGVGEAGAILAELRELGGALELLASVEREFAARMRRGLVVWHRRLLRPDGGL